MILVRYAAAFFQPDLEKHIIQSHIGFKLADLQWRLISGTGIADRAKTNYWLGRSQIV